MFLLRNEINCELLHVAFFCLVAFLKAPKFVLDFLFLNAGVLAASAATCTLAPILCGWRSCCRGFPVLPFTMPIITFVTRAMIAVARAVVVGIGKITAAVDAAITLFV